MNCAAPALLHNESRTIQTVWPQRHLLKNSLHVKVTNKRFVDLSKEEHEDSYVQLQKIAFAWKNSQITEQHVVYGQTKSAPFHFEIVPIEKCRTCFGRMVQQLQIVWRTVFGGVLQNQEESQKEINLIRGLVKFPISRDFSQISQKGKDAFCKKEVIEKQWVVIGKKVNVLFNYAPIGLGGERLHFLFVPKEHRKTFYEVTKEEYAESAELARGLVDHFSETRKSIKNVHLIHKTGKDGGQTVDHWHMHAIFSAHAAQDFWGKLTVVKNIVFGSSAMGNQQLSEVVQKFRGELAHLSDPKKRFMEVS